MRDGLERMTRQFGISDRVVMAGHIPVDKIWTENEVLVMPSRYEGLPLAIVEAMLCGRTIVATDVAGNSEIIDDGVTGFLAKAPTPPALLEALERLWEEASPGGGHRPSGGSADSASLLRLILSRSSRESSGR